MSLRLVCLCLSIRPLFVDSVGVFARLANLGTMLQTRQLKKQICSTLKPLNFTPPMIDFVFGECPHQPGWCHSQAVISVASH